MTALYGRLKVRDYLQVFHALVELLVGFGKSPLNLIALLFGLKRLSLLYFLSVELHILLQLFVLQQQANPLLNLLSNMIYYWISWCGYPSSFQGVLLLKAQYF